jgi:serine/threonine protein kinase
VDRVSQAMNLVGNAVGGKYTLKRVLGIGGMGAVYEAVHAYTNRRVAVKILEPEYAASSDATARFLQEAQAPSSIGHPNIVEVLDAGEDAAVGLYVVLEYLDGEDMESAVEHGNLDLAALLDVTLQLLDALGAAHARGFVHRDIKPANVFLVRDRAGRLRVKLLDFGIARNVSRSLTVGNIVMGTPHYMAPEQAKGLPVDARADLWSVGAMLFHALAGVPPFDGDNPNVIMVNIIMQDAPSLAAQRPDLSKTLVHAVERALSKSADARWADAAQMAAQLSAAPERLDGALKITTTLRNRAGVVSEMRPSAPSRTMEVDALSGSFSGPEVKPPPRTGTLPDEPPPAGRTLASLPAPPFPVTVPVASPASIAAASAIPPAAPVPPPPAPKRRALMVAGVAAAVATIVVVGAIVARTSPPTTASAPTPMALRAAAPAASPQPPVAPPAVVPEVPPPHVIVVAPDAAVAPPPASAPSPRLTRGRHRPRQALPDTPAAPAPTAAPPHVTTHISGVPIGSYQSP